MNTRYFCGLIILATTLIASCRNKVDFNYEDAIRNPLLINFIQGNDFVEGTHNFSENIVEMVLKIDTFSNYYSKTDSIAITEGWTINEFDSDKRVYVKEVKSKGNLRKLIIIKMEFHYPDLIQIKVY
jgi:hypothetical protein